MPKPSTAPTWATDATFTSGPANEKNTKADPGVAAAQGHVPGSRFASQWLNWFLNLVGLWIAYVNEGTPARVNSTLVERNASGSSWFNRLTQRRSVVSADDNMNGVHRLHFFAEQVSSTSTLMLTIRVPEDTAGVLRLTAAAHNTTFGLSSVNSFVRSYRFYNDGGTVSILGPDLNTNSTPDVNTEITVTGSGGEIHVTLTGNNTDDRNCDGWVDYSFFGEDQ